MGINSRGGNIIDRAYAPQSVKLFIPYYYAIGSESSSYTLYSGGNQGYFSHKYIIGTNTAIVGRTGTIKGTVYINAVYY